METVGNAPSREGASYDIVEIYNRVLRKDPHLTMPIAAIESLIEVLVHSNESTIAGTLSVLKEQSDSLKARVPNSISLTAGCDLFIQYILSNLRHEGNDGFEQIRQHLISNGQLFVKRAKEARQKIADEGKRFILDGSTVLTHGGSRVVSAVLLKAAEAGVHGGMKNFKVIYVMNGSRTKETMAVISELRSKGVPVATVTTDALSWAMEQASMVFVGAEGVVEMGGIVSRMGTTPIAIMANALNKPFYVAVETHKFVRLSTCRQRELPVKQNIVDFKTTEEEEAPAEGEKKIAEDAQRTSYFDTPGGPETDDSLGPVDFVRSIYITALITELGVMNTAKVSEHLIMAFL